MDFFGVDLFFPVKRTCFYRSDDFYYLEDPPMRLCFSGAVPAAPCPTRRRTAT
jgi:hypothetical protein